MNLKHTFFLGLLAIMALATSCKDNTEPTPPKPTGILYDIVITVLNPAGEPIRDMGVGCTDKLKTKLYFPSTTTSTNGEAIFRQDAEMYAEMLVSVLDLDGIRNQEYADRDTLVILHPEIIDGRMTARKHFSMKMKIKEPVDPEK